MLQRCLCVRLCMRVCVCVADQEFELCTAIGSLEKLMLGVCKRARVNMYTCQWRLCLSGVKLHWEP